MLPQITSPSQIQPFGAAGANLRGLGRPVLERAGWLARSLLPAFASQGRLQQISVMSLRLALPEAKDPQAGDEQRKRTDREAMGGRHMLVMPNGQG